MYLCYFTYCLCFNLNILKRANSEKYLLFRTCSWTKLYFFFLGLDTKIMSFILLFSGISLLIFSLARHTGTSILHLAECHSLLYAAQFSTNVIYLIPATKTQMTAPLQPHIYKWKKSKVTIYSDNIFLSSSILIASTSVDWLWTFSSISCKLCSTSSKFSSWWC